MSPSLTARPTTSFSRCSSLPRRTTSIFTSAVALLSRDPALGCLRIWYLQAQLHHGRQLLPQKQSRQDAREERHHRNGVPSLNAHLHGAKHYDVARGCRYFPPRHDAGHQQAKRQGDETEGSIVRRGRGRGCPRDGGIVGGRGDRGGRG